MKIVSHSKGESEAEEPNNVGWIFRNGAWLAVRAADGMVGDMTFVGEGWRHAFSKGDEIAEITPILRIEVIE